MTYNNSMIGFLTGTVKAIRKNYLIVATDHVGYKVFVIPALSLGTDVGKPIDLYIHTYVREDQLTLYGFPSVKELEFFELLISVSGVGPKMALAILSTADLDIVRSGIVNADVNVFTKVSGVGKKTAERLILELKGKIDPESGDDGEILSKLSRESAEVVDVLMALGYSKSEARNALSAVPKDVSNSDQRVREALRALAKQ